MDGGSQPGAEEPRQATCQENSDELEKKREEAEDAEVADLETQVQLKLSTRLEPQVRGLESSTCCTLFLPKDTDIVKRHAKRRQDLQRHCGKQTRRGKRKCDAVGHREDPEDQEWGIKPLGPWKGRGFEFEDARNGHRGGGFIKLNTWIKACRRLPTFVKPVQTPGRGSSSQ